MFFNMNAACVEFQAKITCIKQQMQKYWHYWSKVLEQPNFSSLD